jgi:hypothetical protein
MMTPREVIRLQRQKPKLPAGWGQFSSDPRPVRPIAKPDELGQPVENFPVGGTRLYHRLYAYFDVLGKAGATLPYTAAICEAIELQMSDLSNLRKRLVELGYITTKSQKAKHSFGSEWEITAVDGSWVIKTGGWK